MPLFRQEALQQQQQRYYGAIVLRSPQVFVWLSLAVLCLAVLLMSLLIWGQYTRRVSLSGFVIPEGGVLRVYSPLAGRVAALHVHALAPHDVQPHTRVTVQTHTLHL
jgi:membrane fusion protein